MILIPGGTFTMGSPPRTPNSLESERPVHQVTLRSVYLGKFAVTQGQYYDITDLRPSHFMHNPETEDPDGWKNLPVEMVSWYEAIMFCNRLSIRENRSPVYRINGSTNPDDWGSPPLVRRHDWDAVEKISGANGYRLPTEAEWEFAARGGSEPTGNFTFAGSNVANQVAWHFGNSELRVREVGRLAPNGLGLHDMSGNVMEWCWDWFGRYTAEPKDNPTGQPFDPDPNRHQSKVIRGGGWSTSVHFSRVAYRHDNLPHFRAVNLGFRIARNE